MKRLGILMIFAFALLTGCKSNDICSFWQDVPLLENDIRVSEDRFAHFAELALKAPEARSFSAMDVLFDRLKKDEVAYYVYADWIDAAFYNIQSPCRSAALYGKAVERMVSDGVISSSSLEPILQKREWIQYNQKGAKATIPVHGRTLVLVLDVGCPSCHEALAKLGASPEWANSRHVAICCGYGSTPTVPGWDYITDPNVSAAFDAKLTPVFFVIDADGSVEIPYTIAL